MNLTILNSSPPRNRISAANRLPNPSPLSTMDYSARLISRRYNVSPGMARIVAELVATAVVRP
jgi:hypothetical protein